MDNLFMKLRGLYRNYEQVEFELRQYEMVKEVGGLTDEEVAMLAEGPTMDQLHHAKARLKEEISRELGVVPGDTSFGDMEQVLDSHEYAVQVST